MALSLFLEQAGKRPDTIRTTATVQLDPEKLAITRIDLDTEADVPGLSESEFRKAADQAKQNCPVSKALAGVDIEIRSAKLGKPAGARA
jgi:osmotically inducible protein OsmC